METFIVMVPLSILLIGVSIWIFSWAVKSGQYDDLEGPAHSILFDDDKNLIPNDNNPSKETTPTDQKPSHD